MNRNEEYQALLSELEAVPDGLQDTEQRALTRRIALQKRRRLVLTPILGAAACFTAFVLLVNLSIPFASACGRVPWLRELAKAVAFSPSLSAAVENEYVQPIGETKTEGGITVTVEYVIVDRKQLNIFYTAQFADGLELSVDYDYGLDKGYGSMAFSGGTQVTCGELKQIELEFVEKDVPSEMNLCFRFYDRKAYMGADWNAFSAELPEDQDPDYLTEIPFHLEFDPYYTAQGKIIPVDTAFTLDSQRFILTEVELYPTHLRVNMKAEADNTASLTGLDLYLENEYGERFERPGGLTAVGSPESEEGATFWLDSTFFNHGQHLTLYITQARWKDKDAPRVRLDLMENTAENLPQGVRFLKAERLYGGSWEVTFLKSTREIGDLGNLMACHGFWDETGNHYDVLQSSANYGYSDPETGTWIEEEGVISEIFPLRSFYGTVAYLEPTSNRATNFNTPVAIPIK